MQVVEKESDLLAAIELAKTEGQSFFGNPEVYMEKFLISHQTRQDISSLVTDLMNFANTNLQGLIPPSSQVE
jgi:pyruvate carboxylase